MISDQLKNAIIAQIERDLEAIDLNALVDQNLEKFYQEDGAFESLETLENQVLDQALEKFDQEQGSEEQYFQKVQQQVLATQAEKQSEPIISGKPLRKDQTREGTTSIEPELQPISQDEASLTDEQLQALNRARQNEAAWIQGAMVHQLFASQGIDPNALPPGLRDQIFQEVWDELLVYDQGQLKDLFANTTARRQLLQKTYRSLGQNVFFTEYLTQLAATNPSLAGKITQSLQQTPDLVLPDTVFNQIKAFYDLP